jgi:hypothetical protein
MKKVIVFVGALIALAIVLAACTPAEDTTTSDVVPTETRTAPEPEPVMMDYSDVEVLSSPVCADNSVTVTVTNNGDVDWMVDDLEFRLNAAPDTSPDCDKDSISPGEDTVCSGLDVVPARSTSTVQLFVPNNRDDYLIQARCN